MASVTAASRFRHTKDQDRLLTSRMLSQQQLRCFQPDHDHPCFEPRNGEHELCAQRTRVVPDFDQLVRFLPAVEPVEDGSDVGG
jgi:hypothetical protein